MCNETEILDGVDECSLLAERERKQRDTSQRKRLRIL